MRIFGEISDLRHRGHHPHGLLWISEENFSDDVHEHGEHLVIGVADSRDELRERSEELIRREMLCVLTDHGVYFTQIRLHLSSIRTARWGTDGHTHTHN